MGTRRKVAIWYIRRKGEYVVLPPARKKCDADIVFTDRGQMLDFARAAGLMLKQVGMRGERAV